ncbi:MAG TPA: type 4a pilus biogenesis protein PilO [Tepidisphaeraceae bacterium]|jgi:Tfp pilus assembly protein PilO|nr:type 4a pilus biogenesis protein PilO [Tepidisphaeraceae bacterium]
MKSSQRLFFFGALSIALFACVFFLAILPATRRRDALLADSEQKRAALARLNEVAAGSARAQAKIAEVRRRIARFESTLPAARHMNDVGEDIWRVAQANALQAHTLKTSAGKRIGTYWEQGMDLSLAGRLASLYPFMVQLERMPWPVRVDRINLSRIGAGEDMQVDISFDVFLQPDPIVPANSVANVSIEPR